MSGISPRRARWFLHEACGWDHRRRRNRRGRCRFGVGNESPQGDPQEAFTQTRYSFGKNSEEKQLKDWLGSVKDCRCPKDDKKSCGEEARPKSSAPEEDGDEGAATASKTSSSH
jgi:hypothetical protein